MQQIDIKMKRSVFNETYLPFLEDGTRTQIFFGGSSAGKSQFAVGQRTVWDLCKGKRNYLITRNVGRTSSTSTFNQVRQTINDWGLSPYFKINLSNMIITCANGCQALFEGLDDVEKLKSVTPQKGVITDIIVEEATETKADDIKQLKKRLRGLSGVPKRLTLLFNPILRTHWIYDEYFAGRFHDDDQIYRDEDLLILRTTYKDNRFLEPDDIKELENETSDYYYKVYTLGQWGVLGGIIFTNWRIDDLSLDISRFDNIRNGLDFGYGSDPMAFNRIHLDRMRKRIYIFDELHEYGLVNPKIADKLKPIIGQEVVTCDSAEPKSIQELKDNGINAVGAKKGKDSVLFGIQFLQQYEIIIDKSCQETINEFEQYQWKKLRTGEVLRVPVDKNNHHIDCFVGKTLITTRRGKVRIDSLLDDDEVLTRIGYKRMIWHGRTKIDKVVKILLSDGTELECTKTHRFIILNDEKIPICELKNHDLLKNNGGFFQWLVNQLFIMAIGIGDQKRGKAPVILLGHIMEKSYIFIVRFMRMFMGKFLVGLRFITLIGIHWTTLLKTSPLCLDRAISLNTEESVLFPREKILIRLENLLRNGIVAQREGNGILTMQKRLLKIGKAFQNIRHVKFAEQGLKIFHLGKRGDSVREVVNQDIEECAEPIIYVRLVQFAEKCLKQINMKLMKRVHVVVVTDLGEEKDVYNLQVDSDLHEYYANGVLVSNCIRYGLESDMPDDKAKVQPRIAMVSPQGMEVFGGDELEIAKGKLKPGEQLIPVYVGDKVVSYEILRRPMPRGIYLR